MHAFLIARVWPLVCSAATLPAACRIRRNLNVWIIRVGLLLNRLCGGIGRTLWQLRLDWYGCWCGGGGGRGRSGLFGGLYRFWGRGIVNGRVLARGAGRNGEEFLKCENAGFAAFPA